MHAAVITLRIVHVLSAIFWGGTLLFTTFYLFPAAASAGPAAGPVMGALRDRGFITAMPIAAVLTILSGGTLLWIDSAGDMGAYMRSPVGRTFAMAGGLAILAFLIGIVLARPIGMKMMQLVPEAHTISDGPARGAIQAQIKELQKKMAMYTMVVAIMMIIAMIGMATARYMG
ncbi:MAG TPA: hypothetical protein VIV65_06115 [Gemmatimonadaceae bacterium]|jgi:uncharacterized membrane protein